MNKTDMHITLTGDKKGEFEGYMVNNPDRNSLRELVEYLFFYNAEGYGANNFNVVPKILMLMDMRQDYNDIRLENVKICYEMKRSEKHSAEPIFDCIRNISLNGIQPNDDRHEFEYKLYTSTDFGERQKPRIRIADGEHKFETLINEGVWGDISCWKWNIRQNTENAETDWELSQMILDGWDFSKNKQEVMYFIPRCYGNFIKTAEVSLKLDASMPQMEMELFVIRRNSDGEIDRIHMGTMEEAQGEGRTVYRRNIGDVDMDAVYYVLISQEQKQMMKQDNGEKTKMSKSERTKNLTLIVTIIASAFIAVMNVVVLVLSLRGGETKVDVQDALTGNGLAMIGIAVSVWVGINIYNIVDRKDMESLNQKVIKLTQKYESMKSAFDKYEYSTDTLRKVSKQQFINQIDAIDDPSSSFMAREFERIDLYDNDESDIYTHRYLDLYRIEVLLQHCYTAHNDPRRSKELIKEWARRGIEQIELYRSEYENLTRLENIYLIYRKGDLAFYKGFRSRGREQIEAFETAKSSFAKTAEYFHFLDFTHQRPELCGENGEMGVYFANAIGVCYQRMADAFEGLGKKEKVLKEKAKDLREKGKWYTKLAAEAPAIYKKREMYFRNYGVAIESESDREQESGKTDTRIKKLKKAGKQYREALKVDAYRDKVYYTLISNKNKLLREMLGFEERVPGKMAERNYDKYKKYHECDEYKEEGERIYRHVRRMGMYISLAKTLYPDKPEFHAFFIYQRIYAYCVNKVKLDTKNQFADLDEALDYIKMLGGESNLCRVVSEEVRDLKQYLGTQ